MKPKFRLIITTDNKRNISFQKKIGYTYKCMPYKDLTEEDISVVIRTLNNICLKLSNTEPSKVCPKCHRNLTINHFYQRFDANGINQGSSFCKECTIKDISLRNKAKPVELRKLQQEVYRLKRKLATLLNPPKEIMTKKRCKDCVYYKNCFTDTYYQESNFAEACKKYKTQ